MEVLGLIGDANEAVWDSEVTFHHALQLGNVLVGVLIPDLDTNDCDQS